MRQARRILVLANLLVRQHINGLTIAQHPVCQGLARQVNRLDPEFPFLPSDSFNYTPLGGFRRNIFSFLVAGAAGTGQTVLALEYSGSKRPLARQFSACLLAPGVPESPFVSCGGGGVRKEEEG